MAEADSGFVSRAFLRSVWASDYAAFQDSPAEAELLARLRRWAARTDLKETSAEAAFIEEFFRATWGYAQSGQAGTEAGFSLWPQFKVPGAGASGGPGQADLAIGWFAKGTPPVPQALCEFKSVRSALDADQRRKGSTRSPVRQCLDYLSHARKGMMGGEPVVPLWGVASDMNEFRLYWYDRGHQQYVRFVIQPRDLFQGEGMLANTEAARFDRFLFSRLFHRDVLTARIGRPPLLDLIAQRRFRDKEIENAFYVEYRAFRDHLYTELLARNGEGTGRFPGTRGRLVRLAQKILDRLLFVFFCEDMGQVLAFPPKLLQEFLLTRSNDPYFRPDGIGIWQDMLELFRSMDAGTAFGGKPIHRFNGGLFAPDTLLERLHVPNSLFCVQGQGAGEEALRAHKLTVLYLCATYDYAADVGEAGQRGDRTGGEQRSLGLYTLGRIFEQSITELEILEAEAEGRPSVNLASQRKRDGVYYTPEWVVERVVEGTLAPSLARLRAECGWPAEGQGADDPTLEAVDAYLARLRDFTVLDPACGSGAFLITALRYLTGEWKRALGARRRVSTVADPEPHEATIVADILRSNIYGVDINPASVEIAQLALWLHTARGDRPLSSLDHTVRTGNTLITDDFYRGVQLAFDDTEKERVNAFDWRTAFPEVVARGGFDAVVGNPPYVKLQNFRPAQPDVAEYLIHGRLGVIAPPFASTQTGFDLYLPFIEQGLRMLNGGGRLGYIAPSLWTVNEYGGGLRALVSRGRHLDRWLDFRSHQVFEEATTYTALQFFSRAPTAAVRVAQAPTGVVPPDPWADAGRALDWGHVAYSDRWLLLTGEERTLVDRLAATCKRLDDPAHTTNVFVGVQTSADAVYHLRHIGPGRYLCSPGGTPRPLPYEVEIEDAIMRPLVSGAEAKRYVSPVTDVWVLFPYRDGDKGVELIPAAVMATAYPKAWAYLLRFKEILRGREASRGSNSETRRPFDDAA